jgi:hypothetical protein
LPAAAFIIVIIENYLFNIVVSIAHSFVSDFASMNALRDRRFQYIDIKSISLTTDENSRLRGIRRYQKSPPLGATSATSSRQGMPNGPGPAD